MSRKERNKSRTDGLTHHLDEFFCVRPVHIVCSVRSRTISEDIKKVVPFCDQVERVFCWKFIRIGIYPCDKSGAHSINPVSKRNLEFKSKSTFWYVASVGISISRLFLFSNAPQRNSLRVFFVPAIVGRQLRSQHPSELSKSLW